jgi:flavodoxin
MKKIFTSIALIVMFGLTACSGNTAATTTSQETTAAATTQAAETTAATQKETEASTEGTTSEETKAGKDVLVVYFSATGTTKDVAEKIASITNGDLYEIKPAKPYSDADLNWNDKNSRSTKEQNNKKSRPEIASGTVDLSGYKTVYIGYPIWWGEEPRILDTFVESYKFDGIKMIPFCTSASSGVGRSDKNLAEKAGTGDWQKGKRFGAGASEDSIRSWIEGLN